MRLVMAVCAHMPSGSSSCFSVAYRMPKHPVHPILHPRRSHNIARLVVTMSARACKTHRKEVITKKRLVVTMSGPTLSEYAFLFVRSTRFPSFYAAGGEATHFAERWNDFSTGGEATVGEVVPPPKKTTYNKDGCSQSSYKA